MFLLLFLLFLSYFFFFFFFFFFSSRRRHTRCLSDWSSDVCSSDLPRRLRPFQLARIPRRHDRPSRPTPSRSDRAGMTSAEPVRRARPRPAYPSEFRPRT